MPRATVRAREFRRRYRALGQLGGRRLYPGRQTAIYFDPEKMHVLNHKGELLRRATDVVRAIQGWPVIVQAGASEAGQQIAAETAEVIFGSANNLADGHAFMLT